MTDYTDFDALLLDAIRSAKTVTGCVEFSSFAYSKDLSAMATQLATPDSRGERQGWRITDRRLQALRKAGEITFDRKNGWIVK